MSRTRPPIPLILLVLLAFSACSGGGAPAVSGGGGGGGNTIMLTRAQAIWLDANTIVWPGVDAAHSYKLYYSSSGSLAAGTSDIGGSDNPSGVALATGT